MKRCCFYSYRSVYPHGWLLFCLQPNALHQVQQQLAGDGLNADWEGVIMYILGEEVYRQGEVGEWEMSADVVHKVCQCAVGQGPGRERKEKVYV